MIPTALHSFPPSPGLTVKVFAVILFTFAAALLTSILFGMIPAIKYAGPRIATALRGGGRTSSQSRERHRANSALVVVQVALALVLLIGSGLMIRTFQALHTMSIRGLIRKTL